MPESSDDTRSLLGSDGVKSFLGLAILLGSWSVLASGNGGVGHVVSQLDLTSFASAVGKLNPSLVHLEDHGVLWILSLNVKLKELGVAKLQGNHFAEKLGRAEELAGESLGIIGSN